MVYNDDKSGLVIAVGGFAFASAAILEGGYQYGTWKPNPQPGNPYNQTYTVPPFWKQTPRNIMFGVGVTLTFTGLIYQVSNRK